MLIVSPNSLYALCLYAFTFLHLNMCTLKQKSLQCYTSTLMLFQCFFSDLFSNLLISSKMFVFFSSIPFLCRLLYFQLISNVFFSLLYFFSLVSSIPFLSLLPYFPLVSNVFFFLVFLLSFLFYFFSCLSCITTFFFWFLLYHVPSTFPFFFVFLCIQPQIINIIIVEFAIFYFSHNNWKKNSVQKMIWCKCCLLKIKPHSKNFQAFGSF